MLTAALFIIAKTWKQPKCPLTDKQIKMWCVCVCVCVYTHTMEYFWAIKKNENNAIWSNMDKPRLHILSETS